MIFHKGDIWETSSSNGDRKEVLVLTVHDEFVSVLTLLNKSPEAQAIPISSKEKMYLDPRKVHFVFCNRLRRYIKSISENDQKEILREVGKYLGLDMCHAAADTRGTSQKTQVPQNLPEKDTTSKTANTAKVQEENENLFQRLIKAEAQRDAYKDLIYKTLSQTGGAQA